MVTSGPGVTNVITPVADAYFDSSPLVVLTGQVGTGDMRGALPVRQRGFQEVDTVALLRPVTKAQFSPRKPDDLLEIMSSAFRIATEGRPGPVVVDLPMNVQRSEIEEYREIIPHQDDSLSVPSASDIEQAVKWLLASKRPVILAGQGVLLAKAHSELRQLAERFRIPVSQSLLALGAFPTASPLALGFHGHTGNQYAGRAIHESDLLLVVGSRLDVRQTGSRVDAFVPDGRVVRIDLDPAELDHSRVRSDLKIRADARNALLALNRALENRTAPDWSSWHAKIEGWRKEYALKYEMKGALKPQYIIETVNRLSKDQALVAVSGVGSHQQWVARHFDFDFPQRAWLTSGGHGAMGFDLPVAVGAQLTQPDVPVFCFVGDGSLQINIQELASIIEHKLPIKIFVLDNHRLGIVSQFQNLNWGSDPTCGEKWNPDFAAIGRAYGLTSFTIETAGEAEPILKKALAEPGPVLVHCIVDPMEDVTPMLLAGQTMDKMWPYA
jgi:acetolactate synthase-1/2/3 large subunit